MSKINSHVTAGASSAEVRAAYRRALRIWLLLPVVPTALSILEFWRMSNAGPQDIPVVDYRWLFVPMIYFALAVPVGFFLRDLVYGHSAGKFVDPKRYVLGMSAVWASLATVGLVASLVSLGTGRLLPDLFIGVIALMIYVSLFPRGQAMTHAD